MTNRTRTDVLLLAGFCGFLFFYGLAHFGLIGADEPRYAQVAREMLDRHDCITPTLGGEPWLEKPPLYYWQAMLANSVFGVSDWAARLPSAVDATLLVLAVYFFLRRFRRGSELDGALITASCAGIIGYARAASMDMPLAATFTIAMLAWWAWRESAKNIYLAAFYGFLALAMLAKGPVAPFLALIVILACAVATRELTPVWKTLWLPGILLFCAIALPWYLAVQMRNPGFFHEFIVQHNLERFSTNLYHHTEPAWYYLPVTTIALIPWTVFTIAALVQSAGEWRSRQDHTDASPTHYEHHFKIFAACWLVVPLILFSLSRSKLPGYILPALPAATLLLADDLRKRLRQDAVEPVAKWLAVTHALVAAAPIVPGLLIAYLIAQHPIPAAQPTFVALAIALILCAGIALTLMRSAGLRLLRFVTLIPVVLTVGAALKLGSTALDFTLSARPLAREIAAVEMRQLPLAVSHVPRELEYGLTFYRNQLAFNYDFGRIPQQEHLLVAPENSQSEIEQLVPGRRVSYLGHYAPQRVDYFWVAAAASQRR
ncbi:MAG: glycosyltransferase family 39 protein [Candidatus Sulfotelmatobacter sp.]|jgi:4-amino-4-deoxy-L-arabinose transferase-like glycosyltransferase